MRPGACKLDSATGPAGREPVPGSCRRGAGECNKGS